VLVLGLGNDILRDDAVGLRVVRAVRDAVRADEAIAVIETEEMGLALLDHIVGYEVLILVDAIRTGTVPPGFVHELPAEALSTRCLGMPHFLGVGETLALGRLLDLPMPDRVALFAIEVADPFTLGTDLTTAVGSALPAAADSVLRLARQLAHAQGVSQ
jgi:hydrogenase maturation protease